ncbi:MAG: dihydrofolate reductase [Planctomycetota bacterium]
MSYKGLEVSMIAAIGENRVLGRDGDLPWNLPDDLKRFKAVTRGHAVIMGRKTYATLLKALPDRHNIVVSRSIPEAEGADVAGSIEEALAIAAAGPRAEMGKVYIVGGGEIYALALRFADELDLTRVHGTFEGDAFFPEFEGGPGEAESDWTQVSAEAHEADDRHSHGFTFERWIRGEPAGL